MFFQKCFKNVEKHCQCGSTYLHLIIYICTNTSHLKCTLYMQCKYHPPQFLFFKSATTILIINPQGSEHMVLGVCMCVCQHSHRGLYPHLFHHWIRQTVQNSNSVTAKNRSCRFPFLHLGHCICEADTHRISCSLLKVSCSLCDL